MSITACTSVAMAGVSLVVRPVDASEAYLFARWRINGGLEGSTSCDPVNQTRRHAARRAGGPHPTPDQTEPSPFASTNQRGAPYIGRLWLLRLSSSLDSLLFRDCSTRSDSEQVERLDRVEQLGVGGDIER
jgi:hypothetical protein